MKWTDKQVETLKKLCYEGKPNADIAAIMHIKISDVYAKRSQLGITIDKVKADLKQTAAAQTEQSDSNKASAVLNPLQGIKNSFTNLNDAFLLAIASDWVNDHDTDIYSDMADIIIQLKSLFMKMLDQK